jgi:hypothetical protein
MSVTTSYSRCFSWELQSSSTVHVKFFVVSVSPVCSFVEVRNWDSHILNHQTHIKCVWIHSAHKLTYHLKYVKEVVTVISSNVGVKWCNEKSRLLLSRWKLSELSHPLICVSVLTESERTSLANPGLWNPNIHYDVPTKSTVGLYRELVEPVSQC